jgi:hypothetical protein
MKLVFDNLNINLFLLKCSRKLIINLTNIFKMKNITIILALFITSLTFAQKEQYSRVRKINGIETYVLAEPLRDYEVVFGGNKKIQWGSFITGGLLNASIETKISQYIRALQEKSEETGENFDAIVYTSGKHVSAIKFTDEATEETERIATVQKMEGIPLFILGEPLLDYTVELDKGGGIKWKSLVTAGLMNNSIEEDVSKFVKRMEGKYKRNKIDAILYANGKEADGIKFGSRG